MKNRFSQSEMAQSSESLKHSSQYAGIFATIIFFFLAAVGLWFVGSKPVNNVELNKFLTDFVEKLKENRIEAKAFPQTGVVQISGKDIFFPVGVAELSGNHQTKLNIVGGLLRDALNCVQTQCNSSWSRLEFETVLLEGHADPRPIATEKFQDNLSLSAARSEYLLRYLQNHFPEISQIKNSKGKSLVAISAYSSNRLALAAQPTSDLNRRFEIRFLVNP